MGHQRQNQNQLYLFIAKESPSYMFISHKSNILQTKNPHSIRHKLLQSLLIMFKYLNNKPPLSFQNLSLWIKPVILTLPVIPQIFI